MRKTAKIAIVIFVVALYLRLTALSFRLPLDGIPFNAQLETYNDYSFYYLTWLHLLGTGLVPYRDFFYQYPPLFLYALYPLYYIGSSLGPALAIITADSGSAALVYLIARQTTTSRVATLAGLGYALSPFAILYEGYVLFSLQPMLLFVLLSIYLIRLNRLTASAAALAVAVLFKQEALFLLPAYLLCARGFGWRPIAKSAILFASMLVVASLPFLVVSPVQYISTLAYHPPSYPSSVAPSAPTCFFSPSPTAIVESCVQSGVASTLLTISAQSQILNVIFYLGLPAILLLPVPFLFIQRRSPNLLQLAGAYCFAFLVVVFAYFFSYAPLEEVARYPLLPVYALLLVSGTSWRAPATALAAATLSLVLPTGVLQLALPFFAIWAIMVIDNLG